MDPDIFFNFEVVSRINNGDIASWLFVNVIGIIILTGLEIYMFLKLFCIDCKVKDLIHLYCIQYKNPGYILHNVPTSKYCY